jgi:hypothetical protein
MKPYVKVNQYVGHGRTEEAVIFTSHIRRVTSTGREHSKIFFKEEMNDRTECPVQIAHTVDEFLKMIGK